jgi:hypothetical protein
MKRFQRNLLGWIDKIIIYHYMSAILIKFSEIETWALSPFCQDIFTGGNSSLQNDFNMALEHLTMGQKISYLKGGTNTHSPESLERLEVFKSHDEFEIILKIFEKIKEERNPFVHAKYFMGYGNESDTRFSFKSSYMNRDGECINTELTPRAMKVEHKRLEQEFQKIHRLYLELSCKVFDKARDTIGE